MSGGETLTSVSELWTALQDQAGLDVDSYDAPLGAELSERLNIGAGTADIGTRLENAGVSVEQLLDTFLELVRPYVGMTSDLLKMFERAGARRASENLRVRFEFDQSTSQLDFDLRHFREWEALWKRVRVERTSARWNDRALWDLMKVLQTHGGRARGRVASPEAQSWLAEYDNGRGRVEPDPPVPSMRGPVAEVITRTSALVRLVLSESYRARDRETQRAADGGLQDADDENEFDEENGRVATFVESDGWAGSAVRALWGIAEAEPDAASQEALAEAHRNLADDLPTVTRVFDERHKELQEILCLPVWRYRHELYAAWVGARLVNALEAVPTHVHHMEEEILFRFSGTHLATSTQQDGENLHLWAELRSPLENPIGKGRKKAIQPDYSIAQAPLTDPRASRLVVECKQYQQAKTKNFADALSDYANGRPNAHVLLVNYGPIPSHVIDLVDPTVRHRALAIPKFRPGEWEALSNFEFHVRDLLKLKEPGSKTLSDNPSDDAQGRVRLEWVANVDLDLHLWIKGPDGQVHHVSYSDKGNLDAAPWARLDKDHQGGPGAETIDLARFVPGTYLWAVHNYSDKPVVGTGAKIRFSGGAAHTRLDVPGVGSGNWWWAFEYEHGAGELTILNRVERDSPESTSGERSRAPNASVSRP